MIKDLSKSHQDKIENQEIKLRSSGTSEGKEKIHFYAYNSVKRFSKINIEL